MSDVTKVALVTGASRGIGAEIAKRLARDGFRVVVNYAGNADAAERVVREIESSGGQAVSYQADVSDAAAVSRMFEFVESSVGKLDVLVNNAGIYEDQPFVEKAYQYCKKSIQVSVDNTGHHYYTHLYWSQAIYQHGGKDWTDYYEKKSTWLLQQQKKDGSWEGDGVGTVYGTAIALTLLQLPYALAPIYQR